MGGFLGVGITSVCQYESGQRRVAFEHLAKLSGLGFDINGCGQIVQPGVTLEAIRARADEALKGTD